MDAAYFLKVKNLKTRADYLKAVHNIARYKITIFLLQSIKKSLIFWIKIRQFD